jgi:hypothetical protein
VVSARLSPSWLRRLGPQLRARPEDIRVIVAKPKLMESITATKCIKACGRRQTDCRG